MHTYYNYTGLEKLYIFLYDLYVICFGKKKKKKEKDSKDDSKTFLFASLNEWLCLH